MSSANVIKSSYFNSIRGFRVFLTGNDMVENYVQSLVKSKAAESGEGIHLEREEIVYE